MKQQIFNKFKTYSFWISVGGAVALVIQSLARAYGFSFDEEIVNDLITSICGVLVVLGIIGAPNGTGNSKIDLLIDSSDNDVTEKAETSKDDEKNDSDKSKK